MSGKNEKSKRRGEVIHMNKFAGGRETPEEMHRRFLKKKCLCGGPGAIRLRVFAPLDEIKRRMPERYALIVMACDGKVPVTPMGPHAEPHLLISDTVACDMHKVEAERASAKGPSWCIVEIDKGPKNAPHVQVPGGVA